MRFDDTLETVLAADLSTPYGMQSAWRQLVDLIGRRRAPAGTRAMATLRAIRREVPDPVRAASARALEYANPPAPLVRLFALDELPIAMPVLRSARLTSAEWIQLLPDLAPGARHVVRNRRDLSPVVRRALESFGPVDFVLGDDTIKEEPVLPVAEDSVIEVVPEAPLQAAEPEAEPIDWHAVTDASIAFESPMVEVSEATPAALASLEAPELEHESEFVPEPEVEAAPTTIPTAQSLIDALLPRLEPEEPIAETPIAALQPPLAEDLSFVALAGVAASLAAADAAAEAQPVPVQSGTAGALPDTPPIAPVRAAPQGPAMDPADMLLAPAELTLDPELPGHTDASMALAPGEGPFEIADVVARIDAFWRHREEGHVAPLKAAAVAETLRFETDAKGVIRWVDGVSRAPVVGLSLDLQGLPDGSRVDGIAAGAFRRRAGFSNARMWIEGESDAMGDWLISAIPVFDPANGRFTGYRGTGRRPRADERAEPVRTAPPSASADSLRQLVHELRTPTNAIAGFAEMIETQMLGPVAEPYRDRAQVIRTQARELLGAIDDLDLAARIDSDALSLVPGRVTLRPVLAGIADDLAQLSELRGSIIALPVDDLAVTGDRRAVERLLARLMATLVSASSAGERIGVHMSVDSDDKVAIAIDRPKALADYPGDSVLGIDDEREDATLLGTGFALRLARNLARELGGSLVIEAESLTLRLPAAVTAAVGQANLS